MNHLPWRARLRRALHTEWQHLAAFQASHRRWPMPLAAALASGLPLLVGAALGNIAAGLVGSLGGLVFLYLPGTPMHHRMVTLMACGFAMTACYALGLGVQAVRAPRREWQSRQQAGLTAARGAVGRQALQRHAKADGRTRFFPSTLLRNGRGRRVKSAPRIPF